MVYAVTTSLAPSSVVASVTVGVVPHDITSDHMLVRDQQPAAKALMLRMVPVVHPDQTNVSVTIFCHQAQTQLQTRRHPQFSKKFLDIPEPIARQQRRIVLCNPGPAMR